jgi:two-component system sensor kinase FixL
MTSIDPARQLAAITDSTDDAMLSVAVDGTILSWNPGASRIYGYAWDDAVGRSLSLLFPDNAQAVLRDVQACLAEGRRLQVDTVNRARDGAPLEVSFALAPILDEGGVPIGAAAVIRDATGQRRVERALGASEAQWRSIVGSAVDGIIVIDRKGRIESFNPGAERLFGHLQSEVVGRNVSMLMPSPDREQHDGYIERYLRTGERRIIGIGRDVVGRRKDGSTFPLRLSVGELSIDGQQKFTGILHDLTDRVAMEQRLREQSALTRLGEMAAVVAHEVKNPLAGVRGAIQVISTRLPPGSKDGPIMKDIIARLDALNDLMKDMLLFARPPQPKLAPVDVVHLAQMVADFVRQDPGLKALTIDVSGVCPPIPGDAELLKIVLQNLVLNSAHATEGRGRIEIAVSQQDGACSIVLADNGPGMTPELLAKLFTPFFTTKARGTGLGLSTARRFVEAQGGTLHVECPPSGGTTVRILLPLQRRP